MYKMHTQSSLPPISTTPHVKTFSIEWECFWSPENLALVFK